MKEPKMMPADALAMERCDSIIRTTLTMHNGTKQTMYTLKQRGVNFEYIVRGLNDGFKSSGVVAVAEHTIYSTNTGDICAWYYPEYF